MVSSCSDSPFSWKKNFPEAITPWGVRVATFYDLPGIPSKEVPDIFARLHHSQLIKSRAQLLRRAALPNRQMVCLPGLLDKYNLAHLADCAILDLERNVDAQGFILCPQVHTVAAGTATLKDIHVFVCGPALHTVKPAQKSFRAASGELLVENTETRVACRAYAILQKGRIFEFSKGSW
jgi:hypothetical protein